MLPYRTFVVLGSVALLAGCANPTRHAARDLQQRLQTNLSSEIGSRQVSMDKTADGARVILPEPALFSPGRSDLSADGAYLVASVTESLLDPRLMQVDVTDTSATPEYVRSARVRSVQTYVETSQLGPALPVEARPQPGANAPQDAMVVDIRVHCPPGPQGTTWGYANRAATCN